MRRQRSRRRVAWLCARLAALQEESISPATAVQLLAVDPYLRSREVSPGARALPDMLKREAGEAMGDYVASAATVGLTSKTLHFLAAELSPNRPHAWIAMVLGVEFSVLIVVSFVYGLWVFPSYQSLFANFGAELPGETLFMFALVSPTQPFVWMLLLLGVVVLVWRTAPSLGLLTSALDRFVLALPAIGRSVRTQNSDVLAGWLGHIGSTSQQTTPHALRAAVQYDGDRVAARACRRLQAAIDRDPSLQEALKHSYDFDAQIDATLAAAKADSGLDLAAALRARWRAAQETTRLRWRSRAVVIVQLVMGVFIAYVVIAIYAPMFKFGSFF